MRRASAPGRSQAGRRPGARRHGLRSGPGQPDRGAHRLLGRSRAARGDRPRRDRSRAAGALGDQAPLGGLRRGGRARVRRVLGSHGRGLGPLCRGRRDAARSSWAPSRRLRRGDRVQRPGRRGPLLVRGTRRRGRGRPLPQRRLRAAADRARPARPGGGAHRRGRSVRSDGPGDGTPRPTRSRAPARLRHGGVPPRSPPAGPRDRRARLGCQTRARAFRLRDPPGRARARARGDRRPPPDRGNARGGGSSRQGSGR